MQDGSTAKNLLHNMSVQKVSEQNVTWPKLGAVRKVNRATKKINEYIKNKADECSHSKESWKKYQSKKRLAHNGQELAVRQLDKA